MKANKLPFIFQPNQITVARFVLTLIFFVLAYQQYFILSYIIGLIAGLSDFLDGFLARKYQCVTSLGKLLDPLADKIFLTAVLIIFSKDNIIPLWITFTILSREFCVNGLRVTAAQQGKILSASKWGKIKTFTQFIFLALGGIIWAIHKQVHVSELTWDLFYISQIGVVILTVFTGFIYFYKNRKIFLD